MPSPITHTPAPVSVCVDHDHHGHWEIVTSDSSERLDFASLEDARRAALRRIQALRADRRAPCELVVRDAYHRVVERRVVAPTEEPASARDDR